jgi:hypothetical protein
MLKFPYGNCDFYKIITEHYFYVDRTTAIPLLEEYGDQLLFLRPRRFGKSLLLSMLENYYDVAKASEFEKLFGHLAIGKQPTPKHNQYFVLKWDFSEVSAAGEVSDIKQSLYDHLNGCVEQFVAHYQHLLDYKMTLDPNNAIRSFQSVLAAVSPTPYRLYLLIDEYDKFANDVMMSGHGVTPARYHALVTGEGILKTVFSAVKSASSGRGLDRVFITGVSPVVLSDITSGYNVAENIYLAPEFNCLCGFTEAELRAVLQSFETQPPGSPSRLEETLSLMRTFYNGYGFNRETFEWVYNPTLALYFLKELQKHGQAPRNLLDSNLAIDRDRLAYLAQLSKDESLIMAALQEDTPLLVSQLSDRFSLKEMLKPDQDFTNVVSLLYYFGVLTLRDQTPQGQLVLQIPNLVIRQLYVELMREQLLPVSRDRRALQRVVELFYQTGEFQPFADFVEQHQLSLFDNRDAKTATELVIKSVLATLLFDNTFYVTDSETPLQRRYADFTMIVRSDKRQLQLFDILIEFKHLKLGEVKLDRGEKFTGEIAKSLTLAELKVLPAVQAALAQATTQLQSYRPLLQKAYSYPLRLRVYAVVAVGFERLVWEEINE